LGAASHRVELTQPKATGPFELLFPYSEKEKPSQPLPSKVYAKFLEFKADRLLRYLSTMDEDLTVRAAASLSLKRFAELPEPLTVVPREVKP